jgi:hypothetical protein
VTLEVVIVRFTLLVSASESVTVTASVLEPDVGSLILRVSGIDMLIAEEELVLLSLLS